MRRIRHALLMVLVPGAAIAATASGAVGASVAQAYGNDAVHQVEISANLDPNVFGAGTGGGIWLWIELDSGGTGDYTGSDCLHHTPISPQTGAVADRGDVTSWTSDGTTITITGVVIGGETPVTITVPESGHETVSLGDVFQGLAPPGVPAPPGTAHVQVAP
jgi:hypothetical protein